MKIVSQPNLTYEEWCDRQRAIADVLEGVVAAFRAGLMDEWSMDLTIGHDEVVSAGYVHTVPNGKRTLKLFCRGGGGRDDDDDAGM